MSHQNISKMSKIELLEECNKLGITKCNSKDVIMQIGNAVACKFAYHLGKYIINILQQ